MSHGLPEFRTIGKTEHAAQSPHHSIHELSIGMEDGQTASGDGPASTDHGFAEAFGPAGSGFGGAAGAYVPYAADNADSIDGLMENLDHDLSPLFALSSHTSPGASPCEKVQANGDTVAELKRNMAHNSRLVGTFSVLRNTYLKLCKEFNYLLGKFNENERIKIELIHENNELRRLLWETIVEKEMDRKRYREHIQLHR